MALTSIHITEAYNIHTEFYGEGSTAAIQPAAALTKLFQVVRQTSAYSEYLYENKIYRGPSPGL
jgi:hypothetical protein